MERLDGFELDENAALFLQELPALVPVLAEARKHVHRVFASKVPLWASVVNYGYDDRELCIAIPVECSVTEAEHRLDRFEDEYWFDQSLEARTNILFDVQFHKAGD